MTWLLLGAAAIGALFFGVIVCSIIWRVVVEPNEVHIVQSGSATKVYGRPSSDLTNEEGLTTHGNSYYNWPAWIPYIGVQSKVFPLAVFDEALEEYEAYDVGRVPFVVDIVAFFRISDPAVAAKRVDTIHELREQLKLILRGAVRTILAKHDIEEIMGERSKFGQMFTKETETQLKEWGVSNVKSIELMDVRDGKSSKTVTNIMAKKESLIEMESRKEVARNKKEAQLAEIDAKREADVREQEAEQLVGQRTADKDKAVGIANQIAQQEIKEQARVTAEKDMAVKQVEQVRQAEIQKQVQVVKAQQDKEVSITTSEGVREQTRIVAEGNLKEKQLQAEGILAVGTSEAETKRLAEMALVTPQIALAEEIGENVGYQSYLIQIRQVEKDEAVGIEQAKALQDAGIKVIANTGNVTDGVTKVMDLFTSKGGTAVGGALEAFANTDQGKALLTKFGILDSTETPPTKGVTPTNVKTRGARKDSGAGGGKTSAA